MILEPKDAAPDAFALKGHERPLSVIFRTESWWSAPGRWRGVRARPPLRHGVPSEAAHTSTAMAQNELVETVRTLRARNYTPAEIARSLGLSKAEATRLVRALACERDSGQTAAGAGATDGREAARQARCWVNPGWRRGLRIEAHPEWPDDVGAPTEAGDSGAAFVLVAAPDGHNRLSMCGYLVDTWCLGVKNAMGPKRMAQREFEAFKRHCYGPWESDGIHAPLGLAQHLVFGAVEYARTLGFEPHRDFRRAGRLLGSWDGPSAITFGRDGKPYYLNGPYEDPQRVIATLERSVGRDGFHYTVSVAEFDERDDDFHYTVSLSNLDQLGDAA
jgi:hypothetical protein